VTELATTDAAPEPRALALRLIMLGKLVKATLALALAVGFAVLLVTGTSVRIHGLLAGLRKHVTAAWSVYLADALVSVTERRHLTVVTCALLLDGVMTSVEWYALFRGRAWGEWLVVAATSSFLPFEVVALVREAHAGRALVLALNVAIVVYLAWHVRARRRAGGVTS